MARWARLFHLMLSALGILAVLISPAAWTWKLGVCCVLVSTAIVIVRNGFDRQPVGLIRVFRDGTTLYFANDKKRVFGTLARNQWVSRWICSLGVYPAKHAGKQFFVIFSSMNEADEYRRLLMFLRMRTPASQAQRMIW